MGVLNGDELQYAAGQMQNVITNTKQCNERYGKLYTTCYWAEVKMSNRKDVFKDTEIKAINLLGKFLENLMIYSEQIIMMAEMVQEDLYKLQNIDELDICNVYSVIIEEKLDIITIAIRYLSKLQEDFLRYSMLVKKIIEKPSNPSVWDIVKMHLWGNRKQSIYCK